MTIAMPDSVRPLDLPPGYPAYLGYADGRWPTAAEPPVQPRRAGRRGQVARLDVAAVRHHGAAEHRQREDVRGGEHLPQPVPVPGEPEHHGPDGHADNGRTYVPRRRRR